MQPTATEKSRMARNSQNRRAAAKLKKAAAKANAANQPGSSHTVAKVTPTAVINTVPPPNPQEVDAGAKTQAGTSNGTGGAVALELGNTSDAVVAVDEPHAQPPRPKPVAQVVPRVAAPVVGPVGDAAPNQGHRANGGAVGGGAGVGGGGVVYPEFARRFSVRMNSGKKRARWHLIYIGWANLLAGDIVKRLAIESRVNDMITPRQSVSNITGRLGVMFGENRAHVPLTANLLDMAVATNGTYASTFNLDGLRAVCRLRHLPRDGTRRDLIERLKAAGVEH